MIYPYLLAAIVSKCSKWVKFALCVYVRRMCLFFGFVSSEPDSYAVNLNHRPPSFPVWGSAQNPRGTVYPRLLHVLSIFRFVSPAQIVNSVVELISVNVVYILTGPFTKMVKPCKPMGLIVDFVDHDDNVSVGIYVTSTFAKPAPAGGFNSEKLPRIFFITEDRRKALIRQYRIAISHAVVPYKQWFGQRPTRVTSTCRLRYFRPSECICT